MSTSISPTVMFTCTIIFLFPSVNVAMVAARRLARSANTKGFANARSVRITVEASMSRASQRQSQEQQQNRVRRSSGDRSVAALSSDHDTTLTLPDVLGSPPDVDNEPLIKQLLGITGLTAVKNAMKGLMNIVKDNYISELRGDRVADPALHRMFLGNPGTGKTTIAKLYGKVMRCFHHTILALSSTTFACIL